MADEGEFAFIARALAPLSSGWPTAFNLTDDGAEIPQRDGQALVVTNDMLVEGRHFLPDDNIEDLAWKALAVNASDLIAKGAQPAGYLLSIAWTDTRYQKRDQFISGLERAQQHFDMALIGGDTTRTDGPFTLSITAFGYCPGSAMVRRKGAQAGDIIVVTGTIGDAGLGLLVAQGEYSPAKTEDKTALLAAYHRPQPPIDLVEGVSRYLKASADISDGLLSDLGHVAKASELGFELSLDNLPLSSAAQNWLSCQDNITEARLHLASCGDDYQIIGAASPEQFEDLHAYAKAHEVLVTRLGRFTKSRQHFVKYKDKLLTPQKAGFTHF